ncbi:MAG: 50S ribosomal protein L11 methyltransferase [Gammaproteobacteria bacterium]|nr:50S ribosomal protein L11 methyltransferase [Gammaproteobacteria bacterium]
MRWQQLILRVAAERVADIETLLEATGAQAVSLRDAADVPVLEPEPGETPLWPDVTVTALFPAEADLTALRALLGDALGSAADISVEPLSEQRWRAAGVEQTAPRRFGQGLWLLPAEGAPPAEAAGARCVRLHMGHAFGTGAHPTTALCLEWLDANLARGTAVLDYGCGSGVLALAAVALGASHAWAVDNDPEALAAARRNAALNGAEDRVFVAPPEALPGAAFDVVLANILARPLIERARFFADRLGPGGPIVLSGVLREQREAVVAAYEPWFRSFSTDERDGWLSIAAYRRS